MDTQTDRRKRRTRRAIKAAFVTLVLEKGYELVTIMDIASRADYNRGTFYNHFAGKEELLREIHDDFLQGISEALLNPYTGMEMVSATKIYPSTLELCEHIEKRKHEFMALLSVDKGIGFELYDVLRKAMRTDMHIEMEDNDPPVDYEIMLSYRMSATLGVIMYWAETNFKYSSTYMAEQLLMQVNNKIDYIAFTRKE